MIVLEATENDPSGWLAGFLNTEEALLKAPLLLPPPQHLTLENSSFCSI